VIINLKQQLFFQHHFYRNYLKKLDSIQSQLNYNPADHVLQMLTMELIRSKRQPS